MSNERYLIDTNILIYYFNAVIPEDNTFVDKIFEESFNISVITKVEFLSWRGFLDDGVSFSKAGQFVKNAHILNLSDEIVDAAIRIRQERRIKIADAIIAATAKVNELILVTRNTKDFKNIDVEIHNPFDEAL
ncbi:MAG: type II toxin-antitoxin system VapC family toxin [Candidatus Aminicenantes bacterium]|nr:type II toxin-antitoxin system VapC family toxin [Candidatus Aminicenantes bacterium]